MADWINEFHLGVACSVERLRWVLDHLPVPGDSDLQTGLDVLAGVVDELDQLVTDRAEFLAVRAPVLSLAPAPGDACD